MTSYVNACFPTASTWKWALQLPMRMLYSIKRFLLIGLQYWLTVHDYYKYQVVPMGFRGNLWTCWRNLEFLSWRICATTNNIIRIPKQHHLTQLLNRILSVAQKLLSWVEVERLVIDWVTSISKISPLRGDEWMNQWHRKNGFGGMGESCGFYKRYISQASSLIEP
jgi:hypothetical protein